MCITEDNNFLFFDINTLEKNKHIMGFNDAILDISFLSRNSSKIAVATFSDTV